MSTQTKKYFYSSKSLLEISNTVCLSLTMPLILSMLKDCLQMPLKENSTVFISIYPLISDLDIFRPFVGFKQLRLIPRDTKDGERVHFCFADFDNPV
jgi:hypothetical protein